MTPRRTPQIAVRIESLVLDGVAPGDPRVAQAVEQAARRALASRPVGAHVGPAAIAGAVRAAVGAGAPR